jgi:hypothetical protein
MKLQAYVIDKELLVIQLSEQEFEDLRSLISLAVPKADSLSKESPQFRRAAHKLKRDFGMLAKDALNREKQAAARKE